VIKPDDAVRSGFLYFYFQYLARKKAYKTGGSTRASLNISAIREITVPVPPIAEQERIIAAIEEHYSKIDAGLAALERVRQNLKRMRVAVLHAALTGKLIGADLDPWTTRRLKEVVSIASGQTPQRLELASNGDIPYYKVGDMNTAAGELMGKSRGYVDRDTARRFGLHIRPAGTVIFPKRGGAIATNKKRILRVPSAYDLNTIGLVPGPLISPRYLYLWVSSINLSSLADGSNVPQINHGDLTDLELSIPPKDDQSRIVAAADQYLSQIEANESTLERNFRQGDRLRSAILIRAFSGKLVDQAPHDEPSSVLLERISAGRTSLGVHGSTAPRKSRGSRTRASHE
jgi:type I restriction enzyme S subunit